MIDGKFGFAAEVADRIAGIVGTFRSRLVTHINRIFAPFGNVGKPSGAARVTLGNGARTTRRTLAERIFARMVDLPEVGETRTARLPAPLFGILFRIIVVGQHFVFLHVAFARQHHIGPGVFEHRDQVRQHVALRIEVLAGLPEHRTLPLPAVFGLIEIASVALPQSDMAPRKALLRGCSGGKARNQRPHGAVGKEDYLLLVDEFTQLRGIATGQRDEFGGLAVVGVKFDVGLAEITRQQGPHRVAHSPQVILAERIVGQSHRGINPHPATRGFDGLYLHIAARDFAGNDARKGPPDLGTRRGADFGGRNSTYSKE